MMSFINFAFFIFWFLFIFLFLCIFCFVLLVILLRLWLIFVIYYRCRDSGHVEWTYRNVFGKEKARWEYVVRSWEMLFRENVFEPYEEIFLARDNGPHFRNYNIVKYE